MTRWSSCYSFARWPHVSDVSHDENSDGGGDQHADHERAEQSTWTCVWS